MGAKTAESTAAAARASLPHTPHRACAGTRQGGRCTLPCSRAGVETGGGETRTTEKKEWCDVSQNKRQFAVFSLFSLARVSLQTATQLCTAKLSASSTRTTMIAESDARPAAPPPVDAPASTTAAPPESCIKYFDALWFCYCELGVCVRGRGGTGTCDLPIVPFSSPPPSTPQLPATSCASTIAMATWTTARQPGPTCGRAWASAREREQTLRPQRVPNRRHLPTRCGGCARPLKQRLRGRPSLGLRGRRMVEKKGSTDLFLTT